MPMNVCHLTPVISITEEIRLNVVGSIDSEPVEDQIIGRFWFVPREVERSGSTCLFGTNMFHCLC